MAKCVRCNRTALPTAEYQIGKGGLISRLCNACAALTEMTHKGVERVSGSGDKGIPVAPAVQEGSTEPPATAEVTEEGGGDVAE